MAKIHVRPVRILLWNKSTAVQAWNLQHPIQETLGTEI
jgi:hypothetical protein